MRPALRGGPADAIAGGSQTVRVMFCCNPGYYQHLAVALTSLLANNRRRAVDVTVVTSAQDSAAERKLLDIVAAHPNATMTIRHFALDKFRELPTSVHITTEAYLRILVIDSLPTSIDKILYLDCDVVVTATLDELWETDISRHALAAVPDPLIINRPQEIGLPEGSAYVNSGVLLINVARWREKRTAADVIAYAEREGSALLLHDQDAINAVLHAEILPLPLRWNCQARMFQVNRSLSEQKRVDIAAAARDPAIIHYTTGQKPWMFTSCVPKQALYRHYLARTPWRNAPLTRRSLADMPEALYNRIAYVCGSSCSFERFIRTTNTGRALARSGRVVNRLASLSRSGTVLAIRRRLAAVARWGGHSPASSAGVSRPVSPGAVAGMLRKNMP